MRLGRIQNNYSAEGFGLVKEQGLEFVEICCNSQADAEKLVLAKEEIKKVISDSGLPVSSVGRWNHDVQHDGIIDPLRKQSYVDLLGAAIELGAKTFVCGVNYDSSISLYQNYVNSVSFLKELCDIAKGTGTRVAVENCNWNNFIVSPKHWEVVLGEIPDLYIKFDPSHAYNRNENYLEQLSDWCNRVAHIHIKGTVHAGAKAVDDPPAGMDDILWRPLFAILYSRGYDGDLSIEPHSRAWQGERANAGVAFTRDFIRGFMI